MSHRITKDEIKAAVDRVPPEQLETLHQFIKGLASARLASTKTGDETFMEKMRRIKKIDAPPDFSRNIDLYLNGEKTVE